MKNKRDRCEKRGTNKKGFFERIKDSYCKASFPKLNLARAFEMRKSYINSKFIYINWWFE